MITKYLRYMAVWSYFLISSCGTYQIPKDALYDIEGRPLLYTAGTSQFYVKEDGTRVKIPLPLKKDIEFNGGKDSLKSYMNHLYYYGPAYDPTLPDFNYNESYYILFDNDLNIIEVRKAKKRPHASEYYDRIFIDGLKKSKNMWHKIIEGRKWYVALVSYRVF
ncbi:MAG: hypothetical protein LBL97_06575 [Prevotellaceae bacterium]|jgi:hypothetical protein|nr:hypothetical protein [Prevotellaceae bacterium]